MIKFKRGKMVSWMLKNPVLSEGQPGFTTDTKELKVGDGTNGWQTLPPPRLIL